MRIRVYTDSSKTVLEGVFLADEVLAEQRWPGRWLADVDETAPAVVPPWAWFIDIGPFFDRFGAAKMSVLTSADAGIKAIVTDCTVRKWIDLERPDVATALAYIGSVVPAVDATLRAAILTTPVGDHENLALRKLYFGP